MRSPWLIRATRVAIGVALLATVLDAVPAAAKPAPDRPAKRRNSLFALTFGVMNVNNIFCGINNIGELCVDPTNSPVVGGGFWPKGTPDQYIFNSGLQLAGVIPPTAGGGKAAFPWAGDTIGAFFMDPRGDQAEGSPITLVYNALDPSDALNWAGGAAGGVVRDTALFNSVLIGRNTVSQQDLWVRTWDGNPAFTGSARPHPMGVLVEERGMAWNFPSGNEDIIYFIFTFYNVTAKKSSGAYNNKTINPLVQSEIGDIGDQFQATNEAVYNINIPDAGYAFDSLYAAFFMDCDVGNASFNYSTADFVFNLAFCYKSDFLEPLWSFPPTIFAPPLVAAPGFIGVKYLRSPIGNTGQELGLTLFSNTLNSGTGYPDPVGIKQLYRYLSGTSSPARGDNTCTFQGFQKALHFCFQATTPQDTRFFQSSGPFTLPPGEARTIVVAYVQAAPTPTVLPHVGQGGNGFAPGVPWIGDSILRDPTKVRAIDSATGWVSASDANGNGVLEQTEVKTVDRSLLNKSLVAQAVFDNKFLLPFAPEPPRFFLVPGDNQVTIVWQQSETETIKAGGGDPFFAIASQPIVLDPKTLTLVPNPLYDPNFRQYDVEGYRIYRGRTTGALQLVAQFDYAGTTLIDYTGRFLYPGDANGDGKANCAPELATAADTVPRSAPPAGDCPVTFPAKNATLQPGVPADLTVFVENPLVGSVIQVKPGGRVRLADGSVLLIQADTAVSGAESGGYPKLTDTGVTFAFVDRGVRDSFRYFYAVTAFDVNSFTSGKSSLESPRITKEATPRKPGTNASQALLVSGVFGSDGTQLNPSAQYPTIDTAKGTFGGKMPPANDASLVLGSAAVEALPQGDILVRIDSVSAGATGGIDVGPNMYLTLSAGGTTAKKVLPLPEPDFNGTSNATYSFDQALVPYDSANARLLGISFTKDVRMPITFSGATIPIVRTSGGVSVAAGRFGIIDNTTRYVAHSRWFAEGASEPADPTIVSAPDSSHNSGALPGVSRIWAPQAYRDANINVRFRSYSYAQVNWYPADFTVTWNADSSLTVFDSTHHSALPYTASGGSGWGFVNVAAFTAAGVTSANLRQGGDAVPTDSSVVTYNHFYAVPSVCTQRGIPCITLGRKAQYERLDLNHDGTADANGIALWVNGEAFIMAMSAIPAAGTKWHLRAVTGTMSATCTPAVQAVMTDCTAYTFSGPPVRPSLVAGLSYKITVQQKYAVNTAVSGDLSKVHTVPDPYYVTNALEATANTKILRFVNLPSRAIIRIYSTSGVLVQILTHNDQTGGAEETWNLRNRNNQFVASGVYFYHVEGPDGKTKVGRFTVVNFAP